MNKALFLDRDGVINVDFGYVHKIEDFTFKEGIFQLVRQANESGYLVIVVTNQAGIARGYFTVDQFHLLTKWMCDQFLKNNCLITEVYFSPYHPSEGIGEYKLETNCRKPAPGMLLNAIADWGLCASSSILVGDKETDIEAGINSGLGKTILLAEGGFQPPSQASAVVRDLGQVREYL